MRRAQALPLLRSFVEKVQQFDWLSRACLTRTGKNLTAATAATALFLFLISITPSYAIPSPDLVVGSISSISQLIALISAMVGSGAVVVGVRASANASGSSRSARLAWRTVAAAFVVLTLSLAANYYQYSVARSDGQARLETAIQRPTETMDGKTLDRDLKEASYDDQLHSPRGISTTEMQALLDEKHRGLDDNDVLIDVRENAETTMGMFPGATAIRFPDFLASHPNFTGKRAVLYCDNGNRSYEVCQRLAALGIDCRFMIGGLEKWFAEHRSFAGKSATGLTDFRALPAYANKDVLLDTPEVHDLVAKGAVFVDIRYPGEFAAYHLPGAINLPIRSTLADELRAGIAALPHRPIIAPCYDRRSCFYSQILGYQVTQAGYEFLGRYTVPWEYFVAPPPRPYILSYLRELRETWWGRLVDIVASGLNALASRTGLLAAILLLALLSRLTVLPFSLKAERDQIISNALVDEVADIKKRLAADPRRMARAMRAFYRRHGLTPMRNLLALVFLPVISVCVAAVQTVAVGHQQPLLWAANAAQRDHTYVLPVLFAVLICIYLDSAFARTRRHRLLIWASGMVVLTATGALLSAAVDAYLVASACLLLIQRAVVTAKFSDLVRWLRRAQLSAGIVSLDDVTRLGGCGNKAHRLGIMRSRGFTVPAGLVLTSAYLEKFEAAAPQWRQRELDRIWHYLGADKLVVRSSGSAEDGSANSFAGVFESVLDVDRARLESAILRVLASFRGAVVSAYGAAHGHANVLVQCMVEPDYAGVLFTRDLGCPSHSLVECVAGTADKLVSGSLTPTVCRFGRLSRQPIGHQDAPIDLAPLVAVGQKLETLFGGPQDVEWAHADGRFYVVQSRDITRLELGGKPDAAVQNEWSRVLDCAAGAGPDEIIFEQNELAEVLPRPTPLSLSLMEGLWGSGGSIDLACRQLGLGYRSEEDSPAYLTTIFGRLYVNKREEIARAPRLSSLATWRMNRIAKKIEADFSDGFLPLFLKDISLQEAIDFDKVADDDLLDAVKQILESYRTSTSVAASVINIAADYYVRRAKEKLLAAGMEPARYLAHAGQTEFERVMSGAKHATAHGRRKILLHGIGHRSAIDYELAAPRYAEHPAELDPLLELPSMSTRSLAEIGAELAHASDDIKLREAVLVACSFQTLKEDAKHHTLREIAVLRRAVLAVDRRFKLDGLVFHLTFDELELLREQEAQPALRSTAEERRQRAAQLASVTALGPTLTVRQIEQGTMGKGAAPGNGSDRSAGVRVSGSGIVEGRACVVREEDAAAMAAIPDFRDGDIVVSRMVPPAWIPYFQRAGGFVCEVGGWLSHTAIVAREFNVPLIVQAKGIGAIESGETLRLHPDGAVEIIAPQPAKMAN
jgi:rhodanese-related sulfurtransferase/membrane protein insertase Oxa1/YidC/SpoIIIJ/phosphohistidine swiveling domain-containing protein